MSAWGITQTYVTGGVKPGVMDGRGCFPRSFVNLLEDLEFLLETVRLVVDSRNRR